LLGALGGALRSAGDHRGLAEIAGGSGLAFAHRAFPGLYAAGPTSFAWAAELPDMLGALGYDAEVFHADPGSPVLGAVRSRAVARIESELAAGRAAVIWGVHLPEFGLVRGLDRAAATLAVSGVLDEQGGRHELALGRLGEEGDAPALLVAALGERVVQNEDAAGDAALALAIRALSGGASSVGPARSGPDAYDLWTDGLRSGRFDPGGAAYTLAIVAEARALGADYLSARAREGAPDARAVFQPAAEAAWRAAGALRVAADHLPFPLLAGTSIDSELRAAVIEALIRARQADADLLRHLQSVLDARRRQAGAALRIARLEAGDDRALFRCLGDLPMGGLDEAEARCRDALRPRLGRDFFALTAEDRAGHVEAHLYYAPLERSLYPIRADRPALFLFCGWVRKALRGRGVGPRLVAALREHARELGVAGILAEATELDVFLPERAWAALGFREIAREGPMRLCYLPAGDETGAHVIDAAWVPPPPDQDALWVRHAPNCPLLDASRRAAAAAARTVVPVGAVVDESEAAGPEAGVSFGGRRLPNLPLPGEAVVPLLQARTANTHLR